ncbi:MAG: hypothetical protein JOY54_01900 [Acidobacteriaceae bacterium]|nr:hypothetical protein [Acidobacteriaceae bacterium]
MKRVSLITAAVLFVSISGYAQAPGGPPHGGFGPPGFGPGRLPGMHPGKVVTGAPYSGNFTDTSSQTLPDNNSINRSTKGTAARDGQGRTYFTETITNGPLAQNGPTTLTFIFDPVAGYSYVLNSNTKIASRRTIKAHNEGSESGPHEHPDEAKDARPGTTVTALSTPPMSWGVNVTGKQITHTIPAGAIGNTAPIVSTSQIWYATDLQIVVYSAHTDPRMGTSTYSLSNISTAEPAASLFQVPAGYTVQDAPAFGGEHRRPHGPPPPPQE